MIDPSFTPGDAPEASPSSDEGDSRAGKERVLLTGACGTIGTVVRSHVDAEFVNVDVTEAVQDLPGGHQLDLSDPDADLDAIMDDCTAVIHLAWNLDENFNTRTIRPENKRMVETILDCAAANDIGTVVMASSMHAASAPFYNDPYFGSEPWSSVIDDGAEPPEKIGVDAQRPNSPYGASKLYLEALGRVYAQRPFLDSVVSIRFGGLNAEDDPNPGVRGYPLVYLSHDDCGQLIRGALDADDGYHQLYGMSDNDRCPYDLSNDIDYDPADNAADSVTY